MLHSAACSSQDLRKWADLTSRVYDAFDFCVDESDGKFPPCALCLESCGRVHFDLREPETTQSFTGSASIIETELLEGNRSSGKCLFLSKTRSIRNAKPPILTYIFMEIHILCMSGYKCTVHTRISHAKPIKVIRVGHGANIGMYISSLQCHVYFYVSSLVSYERPLIGTCKEPFPSLSPRGPAGPGCLPLFPKVPAERLPTML